MKMNAKPDEDNRIEDIDPALEYEEQVGDE